MIDKGLFSLILIGLKGKVMTHIEQIIANCKVLHGELFDASDLDKNILIRIDIWFMGIIL